jgi:hypothetical protein
LPGWREYGTDAAAGEDRLATPSVLAGAAAGLAAEDDCGRSGGRAGAPRRFAGARSPPFAGRLDSVTAAYPHLQVA